jgi:hypothetical protein
VSFGDIGFKIFNIEDINSIQLVFNFSEQGFSSIFVDRERNFVYLISKSKNLKMSKNIYFFYLKKE